MYINKNCLKILSYILTVNCAHFLEYNPRTERNTDIESPPPHCCPCRVGRDGRDGLPGPPGVAGTPGAAGAPGRDGRLKMFKN